MALAGGGRHLAEQAGGHDRVGVGAGDTAAEEVVGEEHADLVPAQHPPAVGVGHRHRAPVRVGVVGDDEVGALLGGQRHRQVHRARLLGVGEGDRREVGVGLLLLLHDVRGVEAGGLQHLRDGRGADAVQGRVDDGQLARPVLGQLGDGVEVAVDDVLADRPHRVAARDLRQRPDGRDPRGDLAVGRWHDLAAVAEVDLVAVVLRRVVARGDHHPGSAAELADRERQHRRGQHPRHHQGGEASPGHHLGGVAGEVVGAVPGVEADDHPAAGVAGVAQVRREAGRGPGDHDPVHPVRAGAERPAQAGRPELQRPVEAVGQVGLLAALGGRDQRLQLGAGHIVGVLGCPGAGQVEQLVVGGRHGPHAIGLRCRRALASSAHDRSPGRQLLRRAGD